MSTLLSGYVSRSGEWVIEPRYRTAFAFEGDAAWVGEFGAPKQGFIGANGARLTEPTIDFFGGWTEGVAAYNVGGQRGQRGVEGGLWGWVSATGVVVPPRFQALSTFGEGLMPVKVGDRWGYADVTGELRIEARFEAALSFRDGVAVAAEGGKDGYLKPDGSWLLPPQFELLDYAREGRGRAKVNGQWHLLDLAGNILGDGYERLLEFTGGMARAVRGDKVSYIGADGKLLTDRWFDSADRYGDGFAPVSAGEQMWLLRSDGSLHGPHKVVRPVDEGLCLVVSGGVGFMDGQGALAIEPKYDTASSFQGGLAAVKRDGRWTYVRKDGNEVAPPTWDQAQRVSEGVGRVCAGGKWGAVGTDGQVLIEPRFDYLDRFASGLAAAKLVQWPTAPTAPPAGCRVQPDQGLANAAFAGLSDKDELRIIACFRSPPSPQQMLQIEHLMTAILDIAKGYADGQDVLGGSQLTWLAPYAVSFRLKNTVEPLRAAQHFVDELVRCGVQLREVVYMPFRAQPDMFRVYAMYGVVPAVPHPADPRGPTFFENAPSYFNAVFDFNGVPPGSESPAQLLSGRMDRSMNILLGERLLTLHLPDIRICYGVCSEGFAPSDARTEQVGAAVAQALAAAFSPDAVWRHPNADPNLVPYPMTRDQAVGVERIEAHGRRGYCFGVEAFPVMMDVGPDVFRYREQELMEALATVVRGLGMAPAITWQRFGRPVNQHAPAMAGAAFPFVPEVYEINLWERT